MHFGYLIHSNHDLNRERLIEYLLKEDLFLNEVLIFFVELLLPIIKGLLHNLVIRSNESVHAPSPLTTFEGEML